MAVLSRPSSLSVGRCCSTAFARNPRVIRCQVVEKTEAPPQSGSVFYGGKSYSEAEWAAALANGTITSASNRQPAPATSPSSTSMPSFGEVMAFNGAPEIINGRLSMLGFVAALGAELNSGESVIRQWAEEPTGIICTGLLFIAASLVPAFARSQQQSIGPFTPAAEMLNGRAAMIGFAALLAIEVVRGAPLF
ncbi:hypothetical protein V8C86DRAFT_1809385 [Haematococcus lacustris]